LRVGGLDLAEKVADGIPKILAPFDTIVTRAR
jgi:hypothetical protein